MRTDDSQHSGSSLSQSTRLSQLSPFALPEVQLDPRESLDGLQPLPISPVKIPDVHLQQRSPQHDQSPSRGSGSAEGQHVSSGLTGAHAAQQAPLSSTADVEDHAGQSRPAAHNGLQTGGNPFVGGISAGTHAGGPKYPSATDSGQHLASTQPTQIMSSAGPAHQTAVQSRVHGSDIGSMQPTGEQHSRPVGLQAVPGNPTVDDVLSGRSAATDRAALQELLELKAPVPVS